MTEELWTEVHDIVQESVIIPKKKKCKKTKWLYEEVLQRAEKKETKGEGEKERFIPIWMQSSKEQQGEIRKPS